jgi:signal transduction histidine kinase
VELRSLEQMRDNLTHMIVHDLKSPLTALSGYLELLKRYGADRLEAKQASFLDEAMNLTRRLADMINSLLDVRRLESNEMPLNKEVCDLKELAGEALGVLGLDITERRVSTEAPPEPVIAFCDRGLIRRVFVNLVGNAAKFTPRDGAIAIKLESMGGTARVAIVDNGTGIPREYHEKIFERFGQLEAKEFSTGLGLTFCKLAVEAHGGRIGLESEPGKGSTFWFELSHAPTR